LQSTGVSCDWDGVTAALKNAPAGTAADGAVAAANDVPPSVANSAIERMQRTCFHDFIEHLLYDFKKVLRGAHSARGAILATIVPRVANVTKSTC
jgi:hypothetical protein